MVTLELGGLIFRLLNGELSQSNSCPPESFTVRHKCLVWQYMDGVPAAV